MEENKLSFFKKIKLSIFDFDSYQDLAAEKIRKTILYIVFLMIIFGIMVSCSYTFIFSQIINETKEYITSEVSQIDYNDYELTVTLKNGEQKTKIDSNNLLADKVIIETSTKDNNIIEQNINEIKSEKNGILILKDKIVLKTALSNNVIEYTYKTLSETYNINNVNKSELLNILSGNEIKTFIATFFMGMIIYIFVIYLSSILVDILLLVLLTYIVTRICRLRLKYSAIYNITAYSLTLPILLNIIYMVVNIFTGFTIEYFRIMYTGIASIYIITAILIIKSDVIKKQLELNKIVEEQERVKQEIKQREEENNRKKQEEEKEKKKKEEDKESGQNEPETDNA